MASPDDSPPDLVEGARTVLARFWEEVCALALSGPPGDQVPPDLAGEVRAVVNSGTKSYRYVLPTQLAAKLAQGALDCRCLQAARGGQGAFDARTVAHQVVVPFDQTNDRVLGGSPEPYVNNPLRVPEVSASCRSQQKNKQDWDALCRILQEVQERDDERFTRQVFMQALIEVYRRLATVRVVYPTPMRISLDTTIQVITRFLDASSGGDGLLAATSALFVAIGRRFGLYSSVQRASITTADAASGLVADLQCVTSSGRVSVAVEVKDRVLTITQFRTTMARMRERQVSEIFFVAQNGLDHCDAAAINEQAVREFVSGHNVYITDLLTLGRTVLALVGEEGRRDFLGEVGRQLDDHGSDVAHRRAWADLLRDI